MSLVVSHSKFLGPGVVLGKEPEHSTGRSGDLELWFRALGMLGRGAQSPRSGTTRALPGS
jgi:hypothetical protein